MVIHQDNTIPRMNAEIPTFRIQESISVLFGILVFLVLLIMPLPNSIATIGIVLGTLVFSLVIIRQRVPTRFMYGFFFLLAALVAERIAISSFLWEQSGALLIRSLWSHIITPLGMVIICVSVLKTTTRFVPSIAIIFAGLPYIPADNAASISIPVILLASYSLYGSPITRSTAYMVAGITGGIILARFLPCPGEAVTSIVFSLLFVSGYIMASSSRDYCEPQSIATALLLPIGFGLPYQVMSQGHILSGWGVNVNPLAAQAALGCILFMHVAKRRRFSVFVIGIFALSLLIIFRSAWTSITFIVTAAFVFNHSKRIRRTIVVFMALMPLLTLGVLLISWTEVFPETIRISILSRQYHWESSLRYIEEHPLGSLVSDIHPHALGLVKPPADLRAIPGMQMQHAHHFLLDCGERFGIPGMIIIVLLVGFWLKNVIPGMDDTHRNWGIAGFLFLWMHNAADFSWSWPVMIIMAGICIGYSLEDTGSRARSMISRITLGVMLSIGGCHWISGMLDTGIRLSTSQGNSTLSERLHVVNSFFNPRGSRMVDTTGTESRICSRLCVSESFACMDSVERLIQSGKLGAAKDLLDLVLRTDPRGVFPDVGGAARVYLSEINRESGNSAVAAELLRGLEWNERKTVRISRRISYALLRNRRQQAIRIFRNASRGLKGDSERIDLSEELRRLGIQRALWDSPGVADQGIGILQSIHRDISEGRIALAASRAEQITGEIRSSWQYVSLMSRIARARGHMNESIQMAARAAALSNNADAARWDLINALTAGNRHEEALEQIDIHIRHRPDDKEALIRKARILLDMGQGRIAREVVQTALNSGADELSGGIVKAQALRMEGREMAGRRILIELTGKFPTSSWPLWELGRWSEEAGTLGKAKRYASQAVDRSPDDAGCRLLLGRILRKMGKYKEAMKHLSIIVKSKQGGVGWVIDATHELSYIDSVMRK